MLGMNIYDFDTVAFSVTGKTSQTSLVKGIYFLFFLFIREKAAGYPIPMKYFSVFCP